MPIKLQNQFTCTLTSNEEILYQRGSNVGLADLYRWKFQSPARGLNSYSCDEYVSVSKGRDFIRTSLPSRCSSVIDNSLSRAINYRLFNQGVKINNHL